MGSAIQYATEAETVDRPELLTLKGMCLMLHQTVMLNAVYQTPLVIGLRKLPPTPHLLGAFFKVKYEHWRILLNACSVILRDYIVGSFSDTLSVQ